MSAMTLRPAQSMVGVLLLCCSIAGLAISVSVDHGESLGKPLIHRTTLVTITKCHPTVDNCLVAPLSQPALSLPDTFAHDNVLPPSDQTADQPASVRDMKRAPVPFHLSSSLDYTPESSPTDSVDMTGTPTKDA